MAHSSGASYIPVHQLRSDGERKENKCILATCGIWKHVPRQSGKFVGTGSLIEDLFPKCDKKIHLVTSDKVISSDDLSCYSLYFKKSKDKGKEPKKLDDMGSSEVIFKSGLAIVPVDPSKFGIIRKHTSGLLNHRPFTICPEVKEGLRNYELYCHVIEEAGKSFAIRPYQVKGITDEETYLTDNNSIKIESASFFSSYRKGLGAPIAITVKGEAKAVGAITLGNNEQISFVLFSQIDRTRAFSDDRNGGGGEQEAPGEPSEGGEQQEPRELDGGELNIKVDVDDLKPEEQNMQTGMLATESVRREEVQQPRASATSAAPGSVSYPQTEDLKALKEKNFQLIFLDCYHSINPKSIEEWNWLKEYLKEMRVIITGTFEGSLVITVKCESLMILEELWKDYSSGHLGEVVQNCFVTEKILKELNLAELRLKTTMDIEEYNACKMFFEKDALRDALSSEFHSTSSTSESPQKKEQLEKSEPKTKVMETAKLEGTSPSTVLSTAGQKKKLEVRHSTMKFQEKKAAVQHGDSAQNILENILENISENIRENILEIIPKKILGIVLENITSFVDRTGVDDNTQSIPLPATEASDMKGGVPVDDNTQSIPLPATETSDMKGATTCSTLKVPVMSGQLKNNAGERKLRVTLLSAEWKTSSNGDLTTINRELAIQMAKHPNVEVSVFLPQCSEEDKKDADSYNVKLIEAVKLGGFEPVDWLASVPDGHAMDCVLGHGVALGRQIQLIKRNSNYSHCKWIQVVYTAPEEIDMYKSISEGQQKQQTEIELCEMADQVVTIGPKLTDAFKHRLRKQDVFNLMPSIFTEFSDVQQASDEGRRFCVLVIESGDSEDFDVQGYDTAAKAIAELKDKSYQLKFASKQKGKEDELKHKLLQSGIGRNQLRICSLDEDRETLANLFSVVDIAILPSKTEGFGLSALQAISAGLPVLVSGNSGIAEALKEVTYGSQCIVDSEDPAAWASAIKAVHDKKRNVRLEEAKSLRENYLQQFSWGESCNFLVEKMYNLAFGKKQTWNSEPENGGACSSSDLGARLIVQRSENSDVHQCSVTEQEPSVKEIELQGDVIRNRKHRAPNPSNVNTVVKKKREVSEEVSDPVPGPAAVEHGDSALRILEDMNSFADSNTQPIPLPATETSDVKGGVSVETKGWSPLHSAVEGGNEVIIETLLSSGLDIDSRGNDGTTPLMVAAAKGDEKTVDLLLSKGADPHLKNFIGRNLLHAAAEGGNISIVKSMLSRGIDIDSKDDEFSFTPLLIAVKENHVEVMKYLLQKGADISLTAGSCERNALHTASQYGSVAAIEMLLSYDLRPDSRDREGNTPLFCAAASGQIEVVNCLLKHGADPFLRGKHGWSLLHAAAQSGNVIIIETLLSKGLDVDSRDEILGLTPLMVCTKFGKLEALKYLLEKGADKSLKTTPGKLPLLSIASAAGSIAAVEMLLSHGCNIDARDSEGDTPLRHAARLGNTEVVEYLLAQGANPLVQNNLELGLLHLAALSDNALTIEAVLSNNFDINARCSAAGLTPLLTCLVQGKLKAANYLLDRGADEYLKGENGLTVLSAAAIGGNVAAIEMLLKRGHNPNSRGGSDKTPLMWAAEMGNIAAVEYLLRLTH